MSLERIIIALVNLGLTRMDAEVYVYLSKKGSMKAITLASVLNYTKNQIYASLGRLITKDLVVKKGKLFSAISFKDALELLINKKKEKAEAMNKHKKELVINWKKEE